MKAYIPINSKSQALGAVGHASIDERSARRRLQRSDDREVALRWYARQMDGAHARPLVALDNGQPTESG